MIMTFNTNIEMVINKQLTHLVLLYYKYTLIAKILSTGQKEIGNGCHERNQSIRCEVL